MNPLNWIKNLFKTFSVAMVVGSGVALVGVLFFLTQIFRGIPDVTKLKDFQHTHATEVYSAEGRKIGEFTTERRYPVKFESIPPHVLRSFIAAEDSHFYEHHGVDFVGVGRAIISNLIKGRYAQGGSTITQQVAKNILLASRKKELTRKIREMILAFQMEKKLTKNEILNLYINEIYLGHGAFGIGAAARNYFNKEVEQLTIAEAAILAGLPQRPNDWDPFRNPGISKRRQQYVLHRMLDEKMITEQDYEKALKEPLRLYRLEDINNKAAPYFTEYVRTHLMKKYGAESILSQGYKVYTTVRYDMQKQAEKSLDQGLRIVDKRLGFRGVTQHLNDQAAQDKHFNTVHEEILEKASPYKVLPPDIDPASKKLVYDTKYFEEKNTVFFGRTPLQEGEIYTTAVIKKVSNDKKIDSLAQVGYTLVNLPAASFSWVKVDNQTPKMLTQVFKPGDIIPIKIDKIDRKLNIALGSLEQVPEIQGALLSYEVQTGMVRSMVGGTDFIKSQFNRALHAKRQVGSTFKPLVYAAALDKGLSPSSIVTDAPLVFKVEASADSETPQDAWKPQNFSERFEGEIPLRQALVRSMNIPTVKVLNSIGIDYAIQYARTLGITATLPRELTIGLGSWSSSLEELMRAYAIFPRLGHPVTLTYITKVTDMSGKVLEEYKPLDEIDKNMQSVPKNQPAAPVNPQTVATVAPTNLPAPGMALPSDLVISPQTAYVMTDLLKSVVREGTGRGAYIGQNVAGKTGTSNDHRDAWFVGYNPNLVSGVWVGYDKDKPLDPGETGGRASAPIWAQFMSYSSRFYPAGDFPIPDDIIFAYVDRDTGKLASRAQNRVKVAFKAGTVPNSAGDNIPRVPEPGGMFRGQAHEKGLPSAEAPPPQPAGGPDTTQELLPPTNPGGAQDNSEFMQNQYQ